MLHQTSRTIEIIAVLGTISSIGYYLLCVVSAFRFVRAKSVPNAPLPSAPPVSVLKPLKGTDPEMYESFRSHCLQDYPDYEIIFGVSDGNDPAIALVQRLQDEFPQRTIRLLHCREVLGANIKVSNLAQMLRQAQFECVVVNDSDIRVPTNYLRQIVPPLQEQNITLVTCLYRGIAAPTVGSRLESVGISTDFAPGVLAAHLLEGGLRFGLGSTLAFRKADLVSVGGFESLADYLADDYELGRRLATAGRKVKLSRTVVETFLPAYSFAGYIRHQLRWARTIRDSRPWGYVGLGVTFGLFWGLLALLFAGGAAWAWLLFAIMLSARVAAGMLIGRSLLGDRQLPSSLLWLPLRDLLGVAVWIASFVGETVTWRGESFVLRRGKLVRKEVASG